MAWVIPFVAGLLEMVWALLLKQSEGFTRPGPTIGFVVSPALSMFLLAQAIRTLPVGTAYAVWMRRAVLRSAEAGSVQFRNACLVHPGF